MCNEIEGLKDGENYYPEEGFEQAAAEVWNKLNSINVNEHTEEKAGLTYLSWAWAIQTLANNFPAFGYHILYDRDEVHADDTMTVWTGVWVQHKGYRIYREMWLPVMDYRNKSITNPNSMDINKARMRCLTKNISIFGLGAYIYAGEDTPSEETEDEPKIAQPKKKVAKKKATKKANGTFKKTIVEDGEEYSFVIEDAESAEDVSNLMRHLAEGLHSNNMENLVSFWKRNQEIIDFLKEEYPPCFSALKQTFGEIKANLMENEQ